MIDLLSISVLTNALSTLIILFLYLYLYNEEQHEYFLIWTVAWAFYFIYNLASFADVVMRNPNEGMLVRLVWQWAAYSAAGVSTVLMFWAGRSFAKGYCFHYGYPFAALTVVAWTSVAVFWLRDFLFISTPIFLFTGVVFIWTGWIFYAQKRQPHLRGTRLLAAIFILWGLHKLDYPLLRPVEASAPYGYLLPALFGERAAICVIVWVLEEYKRAVRDENEGLSHAYRDLETAMGELKTSMRELDETQEHLMSILESAQDYGIISTTPEGRVVLYNEAAARLLGREAEQMIGCPLVLRGLQDGQVVNLLPRLIEKMFSEGQYETSLELQREREGEEPLNFSALLTATAVRNTEQQSLGMLVMIRDVTQQQQLEERLIASEKLATIGRMASYIAHEIKNPLSSVNLNLELLADEIADYSVPSKDEAVELLVSIQEELDRLTRNIDEYLRFARLPKLHLHLGDINIMLQSLLQLIEPELEQQQIRVTANWDYSVPAVLIDTENLRSVFMNLIRNAQEAMPGGGELRITRRSEEGMVLVDVEDTGPGIAPDELQSIFEPFYTTKAAGTGLGLPYAQQIVHQHGGTLRCTSEQEKGTRFTVSLPVAALTEVDPTD